MTASAALAALSTLARPDMIGSRGVCPAPSVPASSAPAPMEACADDGGRTPKRRVRRNLTNMKRILILSAIAGVAMLSVACAKEPTEALNAAKAALAAAQTAEAADYAPEAMAAAETAQAALEAELKAQSEKSALTRSYAKATELAAAAKTAADAAAAQAVTGKEQAKGEAIALVAGVRIAVDAAKQAIAKAPKGKGSAADLEAMTSDVAGVEASLADIDAAIAAANYKDAKVKAEAAKATLDKIVADVQAAIDAKKGAKR